MLSKSYQEIRKKCRNFFTQFQHGGSRQQNSSNRNIYTQNQLERMGDYFDEIQGSMETEIKPFPIEESTWITGAPENFRGFPVISSKKLGNTPGCYIDDKLLKAKTEIILKYACFFQENRQNIDKMRNCLHTVSQKFLERLIANLVIQRDLHSLDDPAHLLSLFVSLAGNPLNELRILDIFLTFITFDTSNLQALKAFNKYFNTQMEASDLERHRESAMVLIGMILQKYYKSPFSKRNGLDIEYYGKLVDKVYNTLGVYPFKSKLPSQSIIIMNESDNYIENFPKILLRAEHLSSKMNHFVQLCLNLTYKNFSCEYFSGNQHMWVKIFDLIKLMSCIDLKSSVAKRLKCSISDCFQNHQIFLNFIALIEQGRDTIFQKITSKLSPLTQKLHSITKTLPISDVNLFEQLLEEIAENTRQVQLIIKFVLDQLSELFEQMEYLEKKNLIRENIVLYSKVQNLVSGILESSSFKRMFYLLVNIIILFEKVRAVHPNIGIRMTDLLPHVFELILNVYRTFLIQKDLKEKVDQVEFKSRMSSIQMQKSLKSLNSVASANEDEPQRKKSSAKKPNISESETGEDFKYEDLFMKLRRKAKLLLQEVLSEDFELSEISTNKNIFNQFPWLLKFPQKRDLLYHLLQRESNLDKARSRDKSSYKLRN